MRLRNLVYVAVLLVLIGVLISFFIIRHTDRTTLRITSPLDAQFLEEFENQKYLFNLPIDQLDELVIKRSLQNTLIFKSKFDYRSGKKVLDLTHPIIQNVDLKKTSDFVSRILTLREEASIPFEDREEAFKKYGFDNPYISLIAKRSTTDSDIEVLIGNKVEGREGLRYVYSSALDSISIISSTLPLIEKKYGYFYKFPQIIEKVEDIKTVSLKGYWNSPRIQLRKVEGHWELYQLPVIFIAHSQKNMELEWVQLNLEEVLNMDQKQFDLEVENWLLNLSYEDSELLYNRYEESDYNEDQAYFTLTLEGSYTTKNLHFHQLTFSEIFFTRIEKQNFIFTPKRESYRFLLKLIEAVIRSKE